MEDWALLLGAVTARLRRGVEAAAACSTAPLAAHDDLLECTAALEQLHQSLHGALQHHRQGEQALQAEVGQMQARLASLQAQLHDLQLGERPADHRLHHDPLTSLPNRGHFRERLEQVLGASRGGSRPMLAVLYLDLDGFKPINETHGPSVGDAMLREVAVRLARSVRAEDMVCRLGGDEFACLLGQRMDRQQLARLAQKLVDTVAEPQQFGDTKVSVRPSIGIALCPHDGATADGLLKKADAAMYRAKRQRSGYAFFDRRADG